MNILSRAPQRRNTNGDDSGRITALHSWMQKNEQMIASLSGRLAVVETRLSLVTPPSDIEAQEKYVGPMQQLVIEGKKNCTVNTRAWAKVLDHDLARLATRLQDHEQRLEVITNQMAVMGASVEKTLTASHEARAEAVLATTSVMKRLTQLEHRGQPLVMRLGRFELPLEVSGVLMGLLAFMVAALIFFDQKAVLGDPMFLAGIGMVFILSAIAKRLLVKTRQHLPHLDQTAVSGQESLTGDETREDGTPAS